MSAFIVDNKTISVIAKAFIEYGVDYRADGYKKPNGWLIDLNEVRQNIGQSLLHHNYLSVNYRYDEETETPKFEYEDVEINEGTVYGCLACYEYQACEPVDYFESELCASVSRLRDKLLERLLRKGGYIAPYGYGGHDMLSL